jgi:hypothetical protein
MRRPGERILHGLVFMPVPPSFEHMHEFCVQPSNQQDDGAQHQDHQETFHRASSPESDINLPALMER